MRSLMPWVFVGCALVACSNSSDTQRRADNARGTGAGQAGSGPGDFGNTAGTGTSVGATGGSAGPKPMLDPDAPPYVQDDTGASGLDPAELDALKNASGPCGVTLLYPYERTVFPGGLPSPTLVWKEPVTQVYVHASYEGSDSVDYQFAAQANTLTLPQAAWNEITRRTRDSKLVLKMGVNSGNGVTACETSWQIAPGNMTGAVYYNTYNAPSSGGMMYDPGSMQAAVMRVTLGQTTAEVYLKYAGMSMPGTGPCTACHSMSANGAMMAASTHNYGLFQQKFDVHSYAVTPTPQPPETATLDNGAFGALTPDGTRMLTMGNPDCTAGAETFPRSPANFPLVEGPDVARVQDTATGTPVTAQGLDPSFYMWMPQFSPDGRHVVFNHAKPDGKGGTDRRELAMMDYDFASNTFSNLQVLVSHLGPEPSLAYNPMSAGGGPIPAGRNGCVGAQSLVGNVGAINPGTCTGPCYPAYPFFTPDNRGVIFSLTSEPDFANAFPGRDTPAKADLWYVDVETKQSVRLDAAVDWHDSAQELSDFYPTVLPIPIGGYFWVFWTSRRPIATPSGGGGQYYMPPAGGYGGSTADQKRIWVAAITPKATAGDVVATQLSDPSHPGFWLPGQSDSGNVRAFATLNPCKENGGACDSGLDCCGGYCAGGVCTDEVPTCSKTNDRCSTDADCCAPESPDQPQNTCIAGFCSFFTVQTPD